MYAPVSRQLDAPLSVTLGRACAESDGGSASTCRNAAASAPAHYQKASFVQTVQPAPRYPMEMGVSGKLESATSSLPMILIAAVLLLIPAVAMGFFSHARWPGFQRG
ncbi:hypothetical protein [Nevskia ramosa]|uniref:hypothetical protein n=1 Tax=Nevskia ramosa TaxID=64002 RepID=UPI002355FFB6|nr:hypothetical protein [Nevskia ramosa]